MKSLIASLFAFLGSVNGLAADLQTGSPAPDFTLKNHEGKEFKLSSRKGQWTVLYFYPKSETPGCTKQACAFRDSIAQIRALKAEVFGVSVNSVKDQADFRAHHRLNFEILADENGDVTKLYGAKMPLVNISKRWTFVIDPELKIRAIDKNVDPVKDASRVADTIRSLQKN